MGAMLLLPKCSKKRFHFQNRWKIYGRIKYPSRNNFRYQEIFHAYNATFPAEDRDSGAAF